MHHTIHPGPATVYHSRSRRRLWRASEPWAYATARSQLDRLAKWTCGKGHRIHRRDCLDHVVISVSSKFPTRTGQSAALFQPLLGVLLVTATHELCPYYKRCWPTALVGSRERPITARPRRTRAASIVNRARASKATQQLQLGSVARWDWGGQMVLRASRAGTDQLGAGFFHPCVVRTVGP